MRKNMEVYLSVSNKKREEESLMNIWRGINAQHLCQGGKQKIQTCVTAWDIKYRGMPTGGRGRKSLA